MINSESEKSPSEKKFQIENVCNLDYLTEMMGGKKQLISEIMDVFLHQIPEELQFINDGIKRTDYDTIRKFAHTMKSSVSIMGISILSPVLQEMEDLGAKAMDIEKIIQLNLKLNLICNQAIDQIKHEKHNYV